MTGGAASGRLYFARATLSLPACVYGCRDSAAHNYNRKASQDAPGEGSCEDKVRGCTSRGAFNYNRSANTDDGSCITSALQARAPPSPRYSRGRSPLNPSFQAATCADG